MEEVLPPATESGAGFEPPVVRQLTVFLDNRVGRLQTLVRAIEERDGQILAISILNAVDSALIRLICSDADSTKQTLVQHHFAVAEQDVLICRLPQNTRQPLVSICAALLAGELSIHYVYSMLLSPGGPAVVLQVDDTTLAAQLLIKKQFILIGESDLKK